MIKSDERPIRVLRIINRFNLGGPIFNVIYLTKHLPKPFETLLIGGIATSTEKDASYLLAQHQVKAKVLKSMSRRLNPIQDLMALIQIIRIIRHYKPDIVHTHASKAGVLGRIAAKLCGVKTIVHTYHGHVFHGYFNSFMTTLILKTEKRLAKYSSALIAISPVQKKELVEIFKIANQNKIMCIPLGFELDSFAPSKEKTLLMRKKWGIAPSCFGVGIVGRMVPIKNHQLFIDAAIWVIKNDLEFKDYKFYLVGDGELKDSLEKRILALDESLLNSFVFTSWIDDMSSFYPAMDLVCLSSFNEGTPVSLIEGQASGIPVISTRVGGVEDVVKHMETGIILDSFEVENLGKAIIEMRRNPQMREKMSQNARIFVNKHYSYQRLVEEMKQLYLRLITQ